MSVVYKPQQRGGLGPSRAIAPQKIFTIVQTLKNDVMSLSILESTERNVLINPRHLYKN